MHKTILLAAFSLPVLFACATASQAAEERLTYVKDIKPIMDKRCMKCHGENSPTLEDFNKDKQKYIAKSEGPRMNTYENLMVFVNGTDAGALMRRLDDGINPQNRKKDRKPGNMYQYLAGQHDFKGKAARLETFKKWAGSWNMKKRAEWTAEELAAVKAPKE